MDISETINEFGGPSILDADERENHLLFGSIPHIDQSLSVEFGTSQIPDRFFFPPNDSLFAKSTFQNVEPNSTVSTNLYTALTSNSSALLKIDDITDLVKSSRILPTRNIIQNSLDDIVVIDYKKSVSWPSVKIGDSFIQYCNLKNRYNAIQTVKLKYKQKTGPENPFMFVYKNRCSVELTLEFLPDENIRFAVLFLPFEIGKVVSSIEIYPEPENPEQRDYCVKLIDLYGYGGEIIFRPNLLINPIKQIPEIIFYIGMNKFSFEMSNYGDAVMFFIFDLPQVNFFDINVIPKTGSIRPKDSMKIIVKNFNRDDDFYQIFGTTADSLIKVSQLTIIYGVLSDILRINRLYREYSSSHPEIFNSNINELNLISKEMQSVSEDITLINDLPENFNILYKHGIKRLTIDINIVRSSNNQTSELFLRQG